MALVFCGHWILKLVVVILDARIVKPVIGAGVVVTTNVSILGTEIALCVVFSGVEFIGITLIV